MPFLNIVFVGDVEIAEDFDEGGEAMADLMGQASDVDHGAVDAEAGLVEILPRLEVDVGGSAAETDEEEQAEEIDSLAAAALFDGLGAGVVHGDAAGIEERDFVFAEGMIGKGIG